MLDIDHFENVNHLFGRAVGDQAIKVISAARILARLRTRVSLVTAAATR